MRKISYVIIDDDPNSALLIDAYIGAYSNFLKKGVFINPMKALESIPVLKPDLVFIDIQMPKLDGLELMSKLGTGYSFILTTGSEDYALQSYEYNVVDYLLKPITQERFSMAISKYTGNLTKKRAKTREKENYMNMPNILLVKQNYKTMQIPIGDILFLESEKEYVKIITATKTFKTKQSLRFFEEKLLAHSFIRIHRSFIVPMNKINSFSSTEIEVGTKKLPVGRSFQKSLLELELEYGG